MWEEVHPNLKFEVPQCRGALHDSENGFLLQFGVEMVSKVWSFNGGFNGEEEEEKSNVGVRRRASEFSAEGRERTWLLRKKWFSFSYYFIFLKALATCPILSGTKRAHFFSWCDFILSHKERKSLPRRWNNKMELRVLNADNEPPRKGNDTGRRRSSRTKEAWTHDQENETAQGGDRVRNARTVHWVYNF